MNLFKWLFRKFRKKPVMEIHCDTASGEDQGQWVKYRTDGKGHFQIIERGIFTAESCESSLDTD